MLIETIPIHRGATTLIPLHEDRMHRSARLTGQHPTPWSTVWERVLEHLAREGLSESDQLIRCTIVYDNDVREIRTVPYSIRELTTLRVMNVPSDFDYNLKYADRSCFTPYISQCAPKEEPILVRDGLLTDTTYTNIVLEYPDGRLLTPEEPLLLGTQRAFLLNSGKIQTAHLTADDLYHCNRVHLINAMMPLDNLTITHFEYR